MALSYSVASLPAAPSLYSANYHKQIAFPTPLGTSKFYANNQTVLANFLHHKVASPSSFTMRSRKVEPVQAVGSEGWSTAEEVVLVDGFQPASLTPPKDLRRGDFPSDFKFGASTSALQTEGAGTEGGRGESTGDFMIQAVQGRNAADSYNLYMEDVKLLKSMGMNSYRFSIAWPRILPRGTEQDGQINQEGIAFYNNFINALLAEGIEPVISLFHQDLPVALQNKYRGFLSSQIVEDFRKYADICFANFGDRVKYWSTFNEPYAFGSSGYKFGLPEDVKNDPLGSYIATHNIILAHAAAAQVYREKYQKKQRGKIGISLSCRWYEPHSKAAKDVRAAQKELDFMLGWYLDPFVTGEYPAAMRESVGGLPEFTAEQKRLVRNACDYIGINYYTARYAKQNCSVNAAQGKITVEYLEDPVNINGTVIGEQAQGQSDIYVYPSGLEQLLSYIKQRYGDLEFYVTENGFPARPTITGSVQDSIQQQRTEELKAALFDDNRISYAEGHLSSILEAIRRGVNVKGYFVYSLMDTMQVGAGYDLRFGLNFTDYFDNLKRYPKKSAKWFKNFLLGSSNENQK